MIIPDVNILIYAYNREDPSHDFSRRWWEETLSKNEVVGLPWAVCLGFIRIMTNRAVLVNPMTSSEAIQCVRSWLELSQTEILLPGPHHLDILESFAREGTLSSSLVADAHLAALAIEVQGALHSNDSDFSRFSGLRWRNPLRGGR